MAKSPYTDEQFTEFAKRDIVIGSYTGMDIYETNPVYLQGFLPQFLSVFWGSNQAGTQVSASVTMRHTLQRFSHENKRIIGLINGENQDGSYTQL